MSSQQERWLVAFIVLCLTVSALISIAQEKDSNYPLTRSWVIKVEHAYIVVIDTAGVCLYVGANGYSKPEAIAAVPKTQLPKGAGCQ